MPRLSRVLVPALVVTAAVGSACSGKDGTAPVTKLTDCAVSGTTPTSLAVGAVRVQSGSALNCTRLDGGTSGADFLAVVGNTSPTEAVKADYRLSADFGGTVALTAGDRVSPSRIRAALTAAPRLNDVHERLMAEARKLDVAGARAEWQRQRAEAARSPAIRAAIFTGTPTIGQRAEIRVPSLKAGEAPCTKFSTITAEVQYISNRAIIVEDTAAPANGFTTADYAAIASEFDNLIYATDVSYFGSGSDIDANGKIVILYTPEVNKATPRNSSSLLAGFFWAGDLFPRTGSNSCNQSNQAELFYLLVPDPAGTFSTAQTVASVREKTRGTIAHEFQHMLNAGWRLTNAPAFEDVWLDEALAHFAEEAVGRAKLGVGDFVELTDAQIADVANNRRDYLAFFYQNLARFRSWLGAPGEAAPIDPAADTSLAVRGAAWSLVRYSIDQYANNDAKAFTKSLANSRAVGIANLRAAIGTSVPLDTVLTGWEVANFADNLAIPNIPVKAQYRSWNMRDAVSAITNGAGYPIDYSTLNGDGALSGNVRSGGSANYVRLTVPAGQSVALQLSNGAGTSIGFTGAKLTLLRMQ